jgi:hypothetical protein
MARHKWQRIFSPPVRPRANQPAASTEPVVKPTCEDVHADLVHMGMLPRPPRAHKRALFRFNDSLKNYGYALFVIMRRTHPGLKDIAKYRVACYCWRLLSDYEREAWVAPAAKRF